jgi:hypothetical protein
MNKNSKLCNEYILILKLNDLLVNVIIAKNKDKLS